MLGLGRALGEILEERPERVALLASGGLSHDHHRERAGWVDEPFDRWAQEMTGGPGYDPTLWLLAREAGEPVGALTAVSGERGWVSYLGVLAPYRGRGIGVALLRRSITKERHTHPLLPTKLARQRRTYRDWNRGCYQRHSS